MSPSFRLLSAVALLFATASATFTSPTEGSSWDVNTAHQISWDTVGLQAPLQLHLAPAGYPESKYKDKSNYIGELAPSIPNLGKWTWEPSMQIPQKHSSLIIIIIDSGGKYQYSPSFGMHGWPQLVHTSVAMHTTPAYVAPVHTTTSAMVHETVIMHTTTAAPMVHETVIIHTSTVAPMIHESIIETSVEVIAPIHTMSTEIIAPVHTMSTEIIAPIVHTSIEVVAPIVHTSIEVISAVESAIVHTSLWVSEIVHTSQVAPVIMTLSVPPILQTEVVAPIIMTQTQEPVTKIVTQPHLISTEFPPPIVKTILVTESQAPILHKISQPAVTMIESVAPIILTETQAPIVKTLTQAPSLVTESAAPIVVTEELTQTHLLTSHVVITPAHTIEVVETAVIGHTISIIETMAPAVIHTSVVVHPAMPVHSTLSTIILVHSSPVAEAPIFPNTTAIEIPTFTTPLALGATDGTAASSGLGSLTPSFVPSAASRSSMSTWFAGAFVTLAVLFV